MGISTGVSWTFHELNPARHDYGIPLAPHASHGRRWTARRGRLVSRAAERRRRRAHLPRAGRAARCSGDPGSSSRSSGRQPASPGARGPQDQFEIARRFEEPLLLLGAVGVVRGVPQSIHNGLTLRGGRGEGAIIRAASAPAPRWPASPPTRRAIARAPRLGFLRAEKQEISKPKGVKKRNTEDIHGKWRSIPFSSSARFCWP